MPWAFPRPSSVDSLRPATKPRQRARGGDDDRQVRADGPEYARPVAECLKLPRAATMEKPCREPRTARFRQFSASRHPALRSSCALVTAWRGRFSMQPPSLRAPAAAAGEHGRADTPPLAASRLLIGRLHRAQVSGAYAAGKSTGLKSVAACADSRTLDEIS